MHPAKKMFAAINVIGGIAVLGSYVIWLGANPETRGLLWGGIPEPIRAAYTVSMFAAAFGYFPFSAYFLTAVDADEFRVGTAGFGAVNLLYALALFPSALWMPLTFAVIESSSWWLWIANRVCLAVVGGAAIGLLVVLLTHCPRGPVWFLALAIAGAIPFCAQTALLDATVWPLYFEW